jgi:hypothetical protein
MNEQKEFIIITYCILLLLMLFLFLFIAAFEIKLY